MVPLNSPEIENIVRFLRKYDPKSTITKIASLLTVPALHANTIRIETLVHLAVTHCHGRREPLLTDIDNWLNKQFNDTQITSLEDPVEDVFITNVETPEGNRRIFEGTWESNDYFVQVALETLRSRRAPKQYRDVLLPALALLRLSDSIAERVGLSRWHIEPSTPGAKLRLRTVAQMAERARAITFTANDLDAMKISREELEPFILRDEDKRILHDETIGHSSLERRPLVDFGGDLVLALPSAVSPAIRNFVIFELRRMGYLDAFANELATHQALQVERDGLWELKRETESIDPLGPNGNMPSLHAWLLKYDINKYLHVVLLHDMLELIDEQGLSSFMQYPEELRAGLEEYLIKTSSHCRSLPDFAEGMTLIIMGGLGRGFALGFKDWPDEWLLSVIRISDLLMLARQPDRPLACYLKYIKQKEWAERQGVYLRDVDGDYNLYCYWRRVNYQLVPRDLSVSNGSVLAISNDMVLPVREEVRKLADRHVIETRNGRYLPVMRFGKDMYFKSIQSRPIYVSLAHLREHLLAGAIETPNCFYWLVIKPRKGGEQIQHHLYDMWSGFIGLYDRLVFELERLYPKTRVRVTEIRLNFDELVIFKDYVEPQPDEMIGEPEITVDFEQQVAEVKFPSDFLMHFRKPENAGERLVVQSIAKGLIYLRTNRMEDIDKAILSELMNRVIGVSGIRILHLFRTFNPIELLLERHVQEPIFLAHEDFVFSKLRLSEGCTAYQPGTSISSKPECNEFLHRVVDKVWNHIRQLLRQLDRTSVIHEALRVHEAIIRDRNHWRRTAQAMLALYAPDDDVFAIANKRESDRNGVALSARTILEMAICECPEVGGHQLSRWGLDELLAKAALLVEVAMDSDAVNSDLIEPRVELHLNGEYTIDHEFHNTVTKPFLNAYAREEFETAVGNYSKLYNKERPARIRADKLFSADFICSFQAEFGLTPDETFDGLAELMELAIECDSVIVETSLYDLKKRLTVRRGLSFNICEAFFRTFGIFNRPAWDKPPPGFRNRDLNPWRFRRRLSATSRPIFVFGHSDGDKVLYGVSALCLGVGYLIERSEGGLLPQEFFSSKEMKRYIGRINEERGHAFALSVADQLRKNGWEARSEIPMTELGGSAELGDIDVFAWKANGEIQLIECKRLQLARTVAEIAEICRRFRGEAKDELDKHVRRVNWLTANLSGLQRIVGFVPDALRIDARLVTNTHVPMMYITSLPIAADKIGPLK